MREQGPTKLGRLTRMLPEGLVADAAWMQRHGYYGSLRSSYVAHGWLEQPCRGVYRRPRGTLGWEQTVISLQALMQYPVAVGGRTALDLQDITRPESPVPHVVHLYSCAKMPGWLHTLGLGQRFVAHNPGRLFLDPQPFAERWSLDVAWPTRQLLGDLLQRGYWADPAAKWNWPLVMSSPERAYLELLDELPKGEAFGVADAAMARLSRLRPELLQRLLENTRSVKVKRLFFVFADRHRHGWLEELTRARINLGRGNRALFPGGRLDPAYRITVPEEFLARADGEAQREPAP